MSWLTYADDEVGYFHPEFEAAANEALQLTHLNHLYEWVHHIRTPGSTIIPDFILRMKGSFQWILAFEIKRRPEAVYSTRYQFQAKGYAEENSHSYLPTAPKYFAISNLEDTLLFALNGTRPPRECLLLNGKFKTGNFRSDSKTTHRAQFVADMERLIDIVVNVKSPVFETVWPSILADFITYVRDLAYIPDIAIAEPNTSDWPLVRGYFGSSLPLDSARVFILRCLMAEYLRGYLVRQSHPMASSIPALQTSRIPRSISNAIDSLRRIDFRTLFDNVAAELYRNLVDPTIREQLHRYVDSITNPGRKVAELASTRIDTPELLDSLMSTIYPLDIQNNYGKISTDPELAALLAHLTISAPIKLAVDPCCGDGILLAAAFDRLVNLGLDYQSIVSSISGIEADVIANSLASVRIALKQAASLSPNPPITMTYGDMFANQLLIAQADVVLMNPPFIRYEAQGTRPLPSGLRAYYAQSIQLIDGNPSTTTNGQANLFNFYVEFVAKAVPVGAKIGVILDNKWYHNQYGKPLRQLLLKDFEIEGIIEYPPVFFSSWSIATSILIAQKVTTVNLEHEMKFIRSGTDPRSVDLNMLADAFHGNSSWPLDWTCRTKLQSELNAKDGWKTYFAKDLNNDFRRSDWPTLETLFSHSRKGRLDIEEGGVGVLGYPFHRPQYGPRREAMPPPRRSFQTRVGRALSSAENKHLRALADQIPADFRGNTLKNADNPKHYELQMNDVMKVQTLEPPILRDHYTLFLNNRAPWTKYHDMALAEMRNQPEVDAFITEFENVVNLTINVLPKEALWSVLREPLAGELIVPRKMRSGHRVHINPFVFDLNQSQMRISSNFVTYKNCLAMDPETGLDHITTVRLIAAFLVSSFGQLQFEIEGYNREGCLSVEMEHLARIRIFDPRWIRPNKRKAILDAFSQLPYPISSADLSPAQSERNHLDHLLAQEIAHRFEGFNAEVLLDEVHTSLDEWLTARQP